MPVKTVYDRWRQWGLRPYKIGRHLRWLERDVLAWLERQRAAA
ncbi:MAG: helix-turn-helix domain-containing protein [Thermobifida fusca]